MRTLFLMTLLVALGCGSDDTTPPPMTSADAGPMMGAVDVAVAPMADATAPPMGAADAGGPPMGRSTFAPMAARERFVGQWAVESRFSNLQEVPFAGEQESVTTSWGLAEISEDGDTLVMSEIGCRVQIAGGSTMVSIADAVPRSIPARSAVMEFADVAGAISWVRPMIATPVGFRAGSPTEALPGDASDPRVVDQDADGNPGITVSISGLVSGDVYVVQWQRGWYTGSLTTEAGPIVGQNHAAGSAQKTIGASVALLEMPIPSRPKPDTSGNTLRMIPLDGSYDCDRLVAEASTLFGG